MESRRGSSWRAAAVDLVEVTDAVNTGEPLLFNLLYGDFEGGQRVISQFNARQAGDSWLVEAVRHFNVDRPEPR